MLIYIYIPPFGLGIHHLWKPRNPRAHTGTYSCGQEILPLIHSPPLTKYRILVLVPENQPKMADLSNMAKLFEEEKKIALMRLLSLFFVIMVLIEFYLLEY